MLLLVLLPVLVLVLEVLPMPEIGVSREKLHTRVYDKASTCSWWYFLVIVSVSSGTPLHCF